MKGIISDSLSGEPIIGAYIVLISDYSYGAASDVFGEFIIDLPAGDHKLVIKYTGMANDTVSVSVANGEEKTINVYWYLVNLEK